MNRPINIILTLVLLCLGALGSIFLAFGGFYLFTQPQQQEDRVLGPVVLVGSLMVGLWCATTAVGIWKARQWARLSLIVLSIFGVLGSLFLLFAFLAGMQSAAAGQIRGQTNTLIMHTVMITVAFLPGTVGLWWLCLFARDTNASRHLGGVSAKPHALPRGILLIVALLMIAGAGSAWSISEQLVTTFLGLLVTGWKATLVNSSWMIVSFLIAIGLLKRKPAFHTAALWYFRVAIAEVILFMSLPDSDARLDAWARNVNPPENSPSEVFGPIHWFSWLLVLGISVGALWLLRTRRQRYLDSASS